MDYDIILCGVKIGEHSPDPAGFIEDIKTRVIETGCNYASLRPQIGSEVPQEYFLEWAKFLSDNQIYFAFGRGAQVPPKGKRSQIDAETVAEMKRIAGEYFLGDGISEAGSSIACKQPGYFAFSKNRGPDSTKLKLDCTDMADAHANYLRTFGGYAEVNRELGMPHQPATEATALSKYNLEAGADLPTLELGPGDPEQMLPSIRGAARAYRAIRWGTLIAHEWYGGMRHEDILKRKRLELNWKMAYLAGSGVLSIESGDEAICSYGHQYGADSALCKEYQAAIRNISTYIKADRRPAGGPKVTTAFVSGLHDAWGGWGGSSVWGQFFREEWGHGPAEHSWRMLDELGTRRKWSDIANYGDRDLSAWPAYGQYDIVPIEADMDALCRYDRLIFLGWNSMTDENMDKLTEYVRRGGKLLMSAAHLNYSVRRDGSLQLPDNDRLEALFGCRWNGNIDRDNQGLKFTYDALSGHLYPGTKSFICDPICSAGYLSSLQLTLTGGKCTAFYSNGFGNNVEDDPPAVIENQIGSGVATLVNSLSYPGDPALYPAYRTLVREFITASARSCDIQVIGSDRLRWAVYGENKLYLLNTDYDLPITVKVLAGGKEYTVTLESLELKTLEV